MYFFRVFIDRFLASIFSKNRRSLVKFDLGAPCIKKPLRFAELRVRQGGIRTNSRMDQLLAPFNCCESQRPHPAGQSGVAGHHPMNGLPANGQYPGAPVAIGLAPTASSRRKISTI